MKESTIIALPMFAHFCWTQFKPTKNQSTPPNTSFLESHDLYRIFSSGSISSGKIGVGFSLAHSAMMHMQGMIYGGQVCSSVFICTWIPSFIHWYLLVNSSSEGWIIDFSVLLVKSKNDKIIVLSVVSCGFLSLIGNKPWRFGWINEG